MSDWRSIFRGAPEHRLPAGATLFHRGDTVRRMYLVRGGTLALERPTTDGTILTLHVAGPGAMLAEASLFADAYHCDAAARDPARVACVRRTAFMDALRASPDAAMQVLAGLSREVQAGRARIEILRLRRVADRLNAWLDLNGEPAQGEWIRVADAIGVTPPALYRELARRRRLLPSPE